MLPTELGHRFGGDEGSYENVMPSWKDEVMQPPSRCLSCQSCLSPGTRRKHIWWSKINTRAIYKLTLELLKRESTHMLMRFPVMFHYMFRLYFTVYVTGLWVHETFASDRGTRVSWAWYVGTGGFWLHLCLHQVICFLLDRRKVGIQLWPKKKEGPKSIVMFSWVQQPPLNILHVFFQFSLIPSLHDFVKFNSHVFIQFLLIIFLHDYVQYMTPTAFLNILTYSTVTALG